MIPALGNSILFACWSSLCVLLVANAFWPPTRPDPVRIVSFFAGWFAVELAEHALFVQTLALMAFVLGGAVNEPIGVAALALAVLALAGTVLIIRGNRRSDALVTQALTDAIPRSNGTRPPGWQRVYPFAFGRPGVHVERGVVYDERDGVRLRLDVYRGAGEGLRPAVVQLHGGAWVIGSRKTQGLPVVTHLAANGWVAFNVDYRLSPRATWPDHVVDVKRAIAFIRQNAERFGVDPSFIAITGGSAGAHLAALTALTPDNPALQPGFESADTSVQAAVTCFGVYDFANRDGHLPGSFHTRLLEPWVMKLRFGDAPEAFDAASPLANVRHDAPPFLVMHGDRDSLAPVAGARAFVDALTNAGASDVRYVEFAGAQHAYDTFHSTRTRAATDGTLRFLRSLYRPSNEPGTRHAA